VPLTLPSHATMLTGRQPYALGVHLNGTDYVGEDATTLPEVLRGHGYRSGAVVAAYVLTAKFGLAQGFADYDDSLRMSDLFRLTSEIPADEVGRRAGAWLRAHAAERFFAWVHFYDPHLPYAPPAPLTGRFGDRPYDGEVAFVDAELGRLLAILDTTGVRQRTLVVVTSDHGEGFGEHGEEGHGLLAYEETLRVPLLIVAPGRLGAGRVVREPVRLVDLAPTILDLLRLPAPPRVEGRSLAPLLAGAGADAAAPPAYFETLAGQEAKGWAPLRGLVDGDRKFIELPEPELYDLARDPAERRNLAGAERREAQRLAAALRELLAAAPAAAAAPPRQVTAEDRQRLQALGYLVPGTSAGAAGLDPKRGMEIERAVRETRGLLEAGDLDAARHRFATLESLALAISDLYELRHELAAAAGDHATAEAALRDGVARYPRLLGLELRLATFLYERRRLDEAAARASALLARDPQLSQARTLLGLVAEARGDLPGALSSFRAALALEPGSVPLRVRIADLLARTGDPQGAFGEYQSLAAAGVFTTDPEPLFKAGALAAALGRLDRAEELFRAGLAIRPGGVPSLSLALILAQTGHAAEAAPLLEAALAARHQPLDARQQELARALLARLRAAA
jgi:predicted Zn-dependent protease